MPYPSFPRLRLAATCVALWLAGIPLAGQPANPRLTGAPPLRVWQAEDYGGAGVNRAVLQHPATGYIYVANHAGVLEFDGIRWRLIGLPQRAGAISLAVDPRGRLWFGLEQGIGFLAPDARGEWQAVSALDRLPSGEPPIVAAGRAAGAPDGVYFAAGDRLIFFPAGDGRARVWAMPDADPVFNLWWLDGRLHLKLSRGGVYRIQDGELVPVPALKFQVFAARASGEERFLAYREGLRRWQVDRADLPPAADSPRALGNDVALCAQFTADGRIAFGTSRSGLVVADPAGHRELLVDRAAGLPSNRVEDLCVDREGGVWLALRNGLARVQLDSPTARHSLSPRIDSSPSTLALHRGDLFVGGGEGLVRRDPAGRLHPIQNLAFAPRSLVPVGDRLFATGVALQEIGPDDRALPSPLPAFHFVALQGWPGHAARGTPDGIAFDAENGPTWTPRFKPESIRGPTAVLLEHPAGVVWAASHHSGLWRVDLRRVRNRTAPAANLGPAQGLPAGINQYNIRLFVLGGALGAVAGEHLLRYDDKADRFVPAPVAGDADAVRSAIVTASVAASPDGHVWLQSGNVDYRIVRLSAAQDGAWRAEIVPAPDLRRIRANVLLPDPAARTLWFGGPGGLLSHDLAWQPAAAAAPLQAAIRRLLLHDGQLLWTEAVPAAGPLVLPAAHNNLHFEFAAPAYAGDPRGRKQLVFRTRLEGLETEWSPWSGSPEREFTQLPYRDFVLRVAVREAGGEPGREATLAFSILPPWWLTPWAKAAAAALGLGGIAGIVVLRTRTLRRRNAHLEGTVAERTRELNERNTELARLHRLELDARISARLGEERARLEVLRYQLNPHFLFNALNSVCAQIMREPVSARAMVVRLADFCRLTLHRPDEEAATTVAQELKLLRAYLEIEQARLGDSIAIEVSSDPAADAVPLPPFLLLPLVENAVKYGAATSAERVSIRLHVAVAPDGALAIEVANTGTWLEPGAHSAPSHGIGLENLRQRLARYYPSAHEFAVSAAAGWVVVRLRLLAPLREDPHPAHR